MLVRNAVWQNVVLHLFLIRHLQSLMKNKRKNIMVHQYQLLNQNIVLDTTSGGVYSVDKMAYDTIKIFNEQTKEQVIDKIYDVCDKHENPKVSFFVEINPSSLI